MTLEYMKKREKSAVDSKNRIKKLGVYCVQNDISEKEIERETRIKRFGKEEIIDYVLDHAMNLKQCEEVYKKHKIF